MKINLAIGEDAQGVAHVLAMSKDADPVKRAYQDALNGNVPGIVKVGLFIRPSVVRSRDVPQALQKPAERAEAAGGDDLGKRGNKGSK